MGQSVSHPRGAHTSLVGSRDTALDCRPNKHKQGNPAARSGSGAKEVILTWVQARLKDYPIPMTNFSTCWNDGRAFCALIHVFYPESFDWSALDPKDRKHNFTLGFEKAEELAGIY